MSQAVNARIGGNRAQRDIHMAYYTVQPNRWTFESDKIREWVESWCHGRVLNACAGPTRLNLPEVHRNDIDPEVEADTHFDVLELSEHFETGAFDTVVFDPPYSEEQSEKRYGGFNGDVSNYYEFERRALEEIATVLDAGGRVVKLGFSTTCMPEGDGYDRTAVAIFNTLGRMPDWLGAVDEYPAFETTNDPPATQQLQLGLDSEAAQNAPDSSESDTSPDTAQASDELDCGHAAAYAEGEDCLICDQRWNTVEGRRVETAAASDDLEGVP